MQVLSDLAARPPSTRETPLAAARASCAAREPTPPRPLSELMPVGHCGPVYLPGSGRMVWWTGRVAIGLQHRSKTPRPFDEGNAWLQRVLLDGKAG